MRIEKIILLSFLLMLFNCKTVSIQQEVQKTTTHSKLLGSVGEAKDFILEQDYNTAALPKYIKPIKVEVISIPFSETTLRVFEKAKNIQNNNKVFINYVDSLESKPQFLKLEFQDRIALLKALNDKGNKELKDYLTNKHESHIVSGISIAFNDSDREVLMNADEVFLETTGLKSYALKTYKNSQVQQTILFNQGVVFAYRTSGFCWQQDDKYQLQIVDLTEGNNNCPKRTFRSSRSAKKEIDYFKF